jgi:hypothetical protein
MWSFGAPNPWRETTTCLSMLSLDSTQFRFVRKISIYFNIWVLIWGSYNRRSTANQPRSHNPQRCQSGEGSVVCGTILRRESSKHCYRSQYLEIYGVSQAYSGLTIAEQARINREPIADFIDIFWKLNESGLLDFELVVLIIVLMILWYWLSLLNRVSRQTRIQYN